VVIRSRGYGFRIQYDMQVFNVRSKNWRIASLVYHTKSETGRNDEKRKLKKNEMQSRFHFSASISITGIFGDLLAFLMMMIEINDDDDDDFSFSHRSLFTKLQANWLTPTGECTIVERSGGHPDHFWLRLEVKSVESKFCCCSASASLAEVCALRVFYSCFVCLTY